MELVYLWVEDYKNIKKQGFNFSPRFDCEFTPIYEDDKLSEKSKLKIIPKENPFKDFFDENINITAIVGENGSGKTTILRILRRLDLIEDEFEADELNYFIIFRDFFHNENFYWSSFPLKINLNKGIFKTKSYFHFEENNEYFLESTDFHIRPLPTQKINIEYKHIIEMILLHSLNEINVEISSFLYKPNNMYVTSNIHSCFEQVFKNSVNKKNESIRIFEQNFDEYHKFLILEFISKDFEEKKLNIFDNKNIRGLHVDNIDDFSILTNKDLLKKKLFPKYIEIDEEEFNNLRNRHNTNISLLTQKEKSFYIKYFEYFIFDFKDKKGRNYSVLSYGERKLFGLLLNIHYYLKKNKQNKIFILDEYDLGLHPQWQKGFYKRNCKFIKKNK